MTGLSDVSTSLHRENARLALGRQMMHAFMDMDEMVDLYHHITTDVEIQSLLMMGVQVRVLPEIMTFVISQLTLVYTLLVDSTMHRLDTTVTTLQVFSMHQQHSQV